MHAQKLFILIAVLALTTLACGFTVDLPAPRLQTGPTVTEEIQIPDPDPGAETVAISLGFGAGELYLSPGAEMLIEGTAAYNVTDLQPQVQVTGQSVELTAGSLNFDRFAGISNRIENTWDLKLGARPIDLRIASGAYSGQFELGGLALTGLHITDGAADVQVDFAEPNPVVMKLFQYETGASSVKLNRLGNANFRSLIFKSGAGEYRLDFSGDMQADATVLIETGFSNLIITIPEGLNAQVRFDGALANVDTRGTWGQSGSTYTHSGDGPSLDISIKMGAGNVTLRTE